MADKDDPAMERATPVLKTGDYPRAKAFYLETLGFSLIEEGGDPARFGIFKRGGAIVFVDSWHGPPAKADGWDAYIHSPDVDALCEELTAAGAPISRPLENAVYGMREFEVTDHDGNVICFGTDIEPAKTE